MAFRSFKKDIDKVHSQIDKIAKIGSDNYQQYYNFVDDVITRGQYGLFTQVLLIKYNFNVGAYFSTSDIKHASWKQILFLTTTSFQDSKYGILNKNQLYQIGLKYYSATNSLILGTISEVDMYGSSIDPYGYTADEYQKLIDNKLTYLVVEKSGSTHSLTFSNWNTSFSYDKNLLNLYQQAISYLI